MVRSPSSSYSSKTSLPAPHEASHSMPCSSQMARRRSTGVSRSMSSPTHSLAIWATLAERQGLRRSMLWPWYSMTSPLPTALAHDWKSSSVRAFMPSRSE